MIRLRTAERQDQEGYAMAALLVGLGIMAVVLSMAVPVWQTAARREREAELIFRGEQYARAVSLYQRARGGFPPSMDVLVNERFLRKKYLDPMTQDGQFQVLIVGQPLPGESTPPGGARGPQGAESAFLDRLARQTGGIPAGAGQTAGGRAGGLALGQQGGGPVLGVVSKNTQTSLRQYNGRTRYNEWTFVGVQATQQGGAGAGGQGGRGGGRGGDRGLQTGGRGGQGGREGQNPPAGAGRGGGGRSQGPQLPATQNPFGGRGR